MSYMFEKCQRCGKDLSAELVTLAGGYASALCLKHRREWDEYVMPLSQYREYGTTRARLEAAVAGGDEEHVGRLWREAAAAAQVLYAIAKAWAEAEPMPEEENDD